jgi:hypothetical protein
VHPDDRFLARIVGRWLCENVQAYGVFLEAVGRSGERFLCKIGKEIAMDRGGPEGFALDNALNLSLLRFRFIPFGW